jgi:hypothetical protein
LGNQFAFPDAGYLHIGVVQYIAADDFGYMDVKIVHA